MYQIPNRGTLMFSAHFKPINLMMENIQDKEVESPYRKVRHTSYARKNKINILNNFRTMTMKRDSEEKIEIK